MQLTKFTNNSRLLLLVPFLFLGSLLSSCNKDKQNGKVQDVLEHKEMNLSYGGDTRNKLDVYLPANRNEQTPFLLLIHGGAWTSGDKSDLSGLQDSLLTRGIASVSINYRYASSEVHFQELMQDVKAALDYCVSQQEKWNIRKGKYLVGGLSAGAHMALLYAYQYDETNRIGGVISAAGPTDIAQTDWLNYTVLIGLIDEIELMVGANYKVGQPLDARFAASSPRYQLKNVPTLMLHGDNDLVVPYAQSEILNTDLANKAIPHKLVTLTGAGHDLGITNPVYFQLVLSEITTWCNTYGK